MDDRHRPIVRSTSYTVGALGGILIHALGARAMAAERLRPIINLWFRNRQIFCSRLGCIIKK
jgi:hypothetical protein